jgi:RNA polymerase sigma-70 factor, ECF subfamily
MPAIQNTYPLSYIDQLYGYALLLSRNSAEAEFLVQETFVGARRASEAPRKETDLKVWLFARLRTIWRDPLRRQSAIADQKTATFEKNHRGHIDAPSASNAECKCVREAIERLPEEYGEVILLRECEKLSYQEIASVMGCRADKVISHLAHARSRLRLALPLTVR